MIKKDKIQELIALMKDQGVAELSVKSKEDEVSIKFQSQSVPMMTQPLVQQAAPVAAANAVAPGETKDGLAPGERYILSPFVGTFYESPSPGAELFVKQGDAVSKGKVLCIIEAMKLMNEIEAEASGIIKKVLVENEQPVEFEQPLFIIQE